VSVTLHVEAVLLDMDGTLVDSSAAIDRIWSEWAESHDLDPAEVIKVIHGRQTRESIALLLPDWSPEDHRVEGLRLDERETTEVEGIVEVPGARALLLALAPVPHALVTSAGLPLTRARMEAAGLPVPALAVTAEEVSASKPDPAGFLAAAAVLGIPPDRCVAFEDSAAGIAAARRAGMPVVGVGAAAREHMPDWTVPDLSRVRISAGKPGWKMTLEQLV
jgi:sugar-phosphatase